jgi:hypothetical protein
MDYPEGSDEAVPAGTIKDIDARDTRPTDQCPASCDGARPILPVNYRHPH